jgi:hypothetical protein
VSGGIKLLPASRLRRSYCVTPLKLNPTDEAAKAVGGSVASSTSC